MSAAADPGDEHDESSYLKDILEAAPSVPAGERVSQRHLEQENDVEGDLFPISSYPVHTGSDSEEDWLPLNKTQKKRKRCVSENAHLEPQEETNEGSIYYDRPNRFYGPSSTWLFWTRSERETIRSLDQDRMENLSAHLYIAHKIKKQTQSVQHSHIQRREARSTSAEDDYKERDLEKPFKLPKVWTAWPLPPEQVPRVFHTTGILDQHDPFTFKMPQDSGPSSELEDWLIATSSRAGRERLHLRESEDAATSDVSVFGQNVVQSKARSPEQGATLCRSHSQQDLSPSPVFFSSQPTAVQRPPSQPHPSLSQTSRKSVCSSPPRSRSPARFLPQQASLCPVPLADDERARTLLLPAARHIIAKLDKLLMGLHRVRSTYGEYDDDTWNETETQTETEGEMSKSRSRGRSKIKGKSKRGRRTSSPIRYSREEEEEEDQTELETQVMNEEIFTSSKPGPSQLPHSDTQPDDHSISQKKIRARKAKLSRLGLRDWSDVLGMAALTGWDRDVVSRAGRRCARLFDEDMGFRTFHHGAVGNHAENAKGTWVEETSASEGLVVLEGQGGEEATRRDTGDDDDGDGDLGNSETESEHDNPPTAGPSKEDEEAISAADVGADADADTSSSASSPPAAIAAEATRAQATTNKTSPSLFPCPHTSCHRHHPRPFHTIENLARHLNQQHLTKRPLSSATTATSSRDKATPFIPARTGIYCPIATCHRHRDPFSRGNLLYRHVRKVHPEMDLRGVKEGEKERRRRWSRRRSSGERGGRGSGREERPGDR